MTHRELQELAASYVLDALDGEERAALEAHLPACAECRAAVASFRDAAAMLAYAAPPVPVPAESGVRERLLRRAREVRPISSAPSAAPPAAPPAPPPAPPPSITVETRGGAPRPARQAPARRGAWPAWVAAAACLTLAVAAGAGWLGERAERERLADALAAQRVEVARDRAALARRDSILTAFTGPEVHVVSLAAAAAKPAVRVFWNHTRDVFIVDAHGLPPAPAGRTYQLWALPAGKGPISMGTFDASAREATVLAVSAEIEAAGFIEQCALTLEPAGGSPQPTEQPRLIGTWSHAD
jgi:anti-sigma-K factor RskA